MTWWAELQKSRVSFFVLAGGIGVAMFATNASAQAGA